MIYGSNYWVVYRKIELSMSMAVIKISRLMSGEEKLKKYEINI